MTHIDEKDGAGAGAIDRDIQERLGDKLKDAYGEVLNEPVPDRFIDLLDQLSRTDGNDTKNGKHGKPDGNE